PFVFQVKLSAGGSSKGPVTYDVFTTNGTAIGGTHFVPIVAGVNGTNSQGTVTFAQGSTTATGTVYVKAGSFTPVAGAATKTFTLNLSAPTNPGTPLASGTGTIIGQTPTTPPAPPPLPTPIVGSVSQLLGQSGFTPLDF